MKHIALLAPLALVLTTACEDEAAKQQAAAEARAKAEATVKAKALADAMTVNVRCYAAVKWQEGPLKRGGIGDPAVYVAYYRNMIEKRLGDEVLPAKPPAPELSKANLDAYLDWAVKDHIDNQFTRGGDANGDGQVTPGETRTMGHMTVSTCVQSAAEFGAGPMAKLNPAERYEKMQYLREHLRLRGN